jgi:hypothetical protein
MRCAYLIATAVALSACGPKTGTGTAPGTAPPLASQMHGLWSGGASKSPLGEQPYAIVFRTEAAGVIAETPPTLDEEVLPPGAYQRFVFPQGAASTNASFKTSMGAAGLQDGELVRDATRSSDTKMILCEGGNCESMELRFESVGVDKMSFQVWMGGKLHADIALEFAGDM